LLPVFVPHRLTGFIELALLCFQFLLARHEPGGLLFDFFVPAGDPFLHINALHAQLFLPFIEAGG